MTNAEFKKELEQRTKRFAVLSISLNICARIHFPALERFTLFCG